MRRFITVLTAAFAVVAFSSAVMAQAPATTEKPKAEKTAVVKKAAVPTAAGKIAKYDEATKTLTVTTKKGDENFILGADAKIMAGAKVATATDLVAGKNVKVTYTEADGKMTATKVTIAAEKTAKAPKAEKKDAKAPETK